MDKRLKQILSGKKARPTTKKAAPLPPTVTRTTVHRSQGRPAPPADRSKVKETSMILSSFINMPFIEPISPLPVDPPSAPDDDDDVHLSSVRSSDYDERSLSDSSLSKSRLLPEDKLYSPVKPLRPHPRHLPPGRVQEPEPAPKSLLITLLLPPRPPPHPSRLPRHQVQARNSRTGKVPSHAREDLRAGELKRVTPYDRTTVKLTSQVRPELKDRKLVTKPVPPRSKVSTHLERVSSKEPSKAHPNPTGIRGSTNRREELSASMARGHTSVTNERTRPEPAVAMARNQNSAPADRERIKAEISSPPARGANLVNERKRGDPLAPSARGKSHLVNERKRPDSSSRLGREAHPSARDGIKVEAESDAFDKPVSRKVRPPPEEPSTKVNPASHLRKAGETTSVKPTGHSRLEGPPRRKEVPPPRPDSGWPKTHGYDPTSPIVNLSDEYVGPPLNGKSQLDRTSRPNQEHPPARPSNGLKRSHDPSQPTLSKKSKHAQDEDSLDYLRANRTDQSSVNRDQSSLGPLSSTRPGKPASTLPANTPPKSAETVRPVASLPYLPHQTLPSRFHFQAQSQPPPRKYLEDLTKYFLLYWKTATHIYNLGKAKLAENQTEQGYILYLESFFWYIKAFYYQELVGSSDTIKYIKAWELLLGNVDKCSSYFSESPTGGELYGMVHYLKIFICNRLMVQIIPFARPQCTVADSSLHFYRQLQEHIAFSACQAQLVLGPNQVKSHFPELYHQFQARDFQDFPPILPPKDNPHRLVEFCRFIFESYCTKQGVPASAIKDDPTSQGLPPLTPSL